MPALGIDGYEGRPFQIEKFSLFQHKGEGFHPVMITDQAHEQARASLKKDWLFTRGFW